MAPSLTTFYCAIALILSTILICLSATIGTATLLLSAMFTFLIGVPTWKPSPREGKAHCEALHVIFYKGIVFHSRKHPKKHKFSYKVRFVYLNLDETPEWFSTSTKHHLSSIEARKIAGTNGKVYILTNPVSTGYEQNPISVYYCFSGSEEQEELKTCIAEVTNTPWGERCTFTFDPNGGFPKPLHVSPFMDMQSTWQFKTSPPGQKVQLSITASHPEFGDYFLAVLTGEKVENVTNPLLFLWLMPHKVAFGIYWQAFLLWLKGVPLVVHPKYISGEEYKKKVLERKEKQDRPGWIQWREAPYWPWK